jgi:peroxiredoxin
MPIEMRPNKHLKVAALFLLIVIQSCSSSGDKDSSTVAVQAVQNDLPQMVVTKSDGSQLSMKELTGKIVLILFQTDCDHCQREAAAIQENISAFKPYSVYFITTSSQQQIETFAKEYKLADYPNVHFCQTTNQSVLDNFGHIDAPSLYIFSSDRKLVKSFNGETPINEILKYI